MPKTEKITRHEKINLPEDVKAAILNKEDGMMLHLNKEELQYLIDVLWTRPRSEHHELWVRIVELAKPHQLITTTENSIEDETRN